MTTLRKTALDAEAENYWTEYYKDSGYGEQWVKKIPRRVASELLRRTGAASQPHFALQSITPWATVVHEQGVSLEGTATVASGAKRQVLAFVADFSHEGKVLAFDATPIAPRKTQSNDSAAE
jgi:hypothetical protein